ncbi:MAG TPA: hypothetical protein PKK96_14595 [Anaerolineales bacterium]|nr:hypothetical protein [Anaerolineales bacterium]HMR99977.1 hypothetical protein [Anaerolineales bacterium]HNQ94551.1 hypothetical protein [Anaerolineales bacterium]HNS62229.1 hypothetical protein [Anaerolineales bacterium]
MQFLERFDQFIEDMMDGLFYLMRRNQPTLPFEDVVAKLKRDGKLVEQ